jgi:hypothetical protein
MDNDTNNAQAMPKKKRVTKGGIKVSMDSKAYKYFMAKKGGNTREASLAIAGYRKTNNLAEIENTKTFLELERRYADELRAQISLREIASEHIKNIVQDVDKGAKNKAIEIALNRIEPNNEPQEKDEKVLVVLKS